MGKEREGGEDQISKGGMKKIDNLKVEQGREVYGRRDRLKLEVQGEHRESEQIKIQRALTAVKVPAQKKNVLPKNRFPIKGFCLIFSCRS